MTRRPTDKSTRRVIRLMWLMAVVGVVAGAVVLTDVSLRLRSIRERREQTEHARNSVASTLDDLRSYRLHLMEQLDRLHLHMFGRSLSAIEDLPASLVEFDEQRVASGAEDLRTNIAQLGGNDAFADAALESLTQGLELTHASLGRVWQGVARSDGLMEQCAEAEKRVRGDLEELSAIVSRGVGLNRLHVARHLALIRVTADADRQQHLERLVQSVRQVQQPWLLNDDLQELALDTERFFHCDNVDSLRSDKDNRLRQTLARLKRNSVRLGEDSDRFLTGLISYQEHLFGTGSQDDKQHQVMLTTGDGFYQKKVKLIDRVRSLRAESEEAEQAARSCRAAEQQLNQAVADLYAVAARADSNLLENASDALFMIAGGASVLFLAVAWWIVGLVSRVMRASVDRQRESTEMAKIIRESPTEVYILKRDTLRFVEVNYGTCNNLGYTREEMLELTPVELTPHEHIGPLKESLRPLGDFDVDRLEFHTVHFRKDGSTYPVQVVLHRATYHDEPVYVAFVNDLTQVKLLEQQLAQAQKLESIGQLAAGLAHEINTPMQFIADNVDFLATSFRRLMEFTDTYKQLLFTNEQKAWQQRRAEIQAASEVNNVEYHSHEMVAAIKESQEGIQRVVEIARAMKEFSHPGGKEKVRANINDVIRSTATISRNRWKYTAELVLDLDPDLPAVPLLVSEINQVLLNLMVNASDAIAERFADQPDTLGTVTVRTRSVDDGIAIEVEDNGGGIPEEVRDRIFDPFFTTKEVGKGTGQGLSICRNVVNKQHGGRMSVESTPGIGTIFTVWLPMQAPDVGSAQQFREVSGCQDVLAEACS